MEKNIIPLIDLTAKTTIQEHEKQAKARENAPTEKAKRLGSGMFWALVGGIIGLLIPILVNLILRALGMRTFF